MYEPFQPATDHENSSKMLSTAQAVKEWETSLKVLAEIQAHVAAHPNQTTTPSHLISKLNLIGVALSCELACPIAT